MAGDTRRIALTIQSAFDPKGTTAAVKALKDLIAAAQQAGKLPPPDAKSMTLAASEAAKLAQAQSKIAVSGSQVAIAQSRAETATTNAAIATQKLAVATSRTTIAENQVSASAARAAAAHSTAAAAALREAAARERLAKVKPPPIPPPPDPGPYNKLFDAAKLASGAFAAFEAGKAVYGLAQMGASADAAKQSFYSLAQAAGQSGEQLLAALTKASGGTVAQVDMIKSANTALLLLGSDAATKLPKLLEIAKASATTLGTDVGMVFDSLVTGISRNSTELIDNAGITVKAGEAYAVYAASIGKSADALSSAERQQAILNAVLVGGEDILARTAGAGETAATTMQRLAASASNLAVAIGSSLANAAQPVVSGLAGITQAAADGIGQLTTLSDRLNATSQDFVASSGSYDEYLAKVNEVNSALPPFVQQMEVLPEAAFNAAKGFEEAGAGAADASSQIHELASSSEGGASTMELYNGALERAANTAPEVRDTLAGFGEELLTTAASSDTARSATDTLLNAYRMGVGDIEAMDSTSAVLTSTQGYLAEANAATSGSINEYVLAALNGQIGAEELETAIINLVAGQEMLAGATDMDTAATEVNTEATAASTDEAFANMTARLEQELAARQAEQAEYDLDSALRTAAGGGQAAAGVVAMLVSKYGIEANEVYRLIGLYQQLNAARGAGKGAIGNIGGMVGAGSRAASAQRARMNVGASYGGEAIARPARGGRGGGGGGGSGGGGGGGGSSAKPKKTDAEKAAEKQVKASEAAAAKLTEIQRNAAEKIQDINQKTAEKLIEIDRKAAEERAKIAQDLADDIATSAASAAADAEVNDLDLVGADKDELKKLQAREKAEADAQKRRAEASKKAQEEIAAGNAEAAAAEYEAQQEYIDKQQQLDETYYAKQAELGKNQKAQAELDKQYAEATAALENQRDTELGIEQAKIEAKQAEREKEKAEVIADAEEQKEKVVSAAMEQAEKVKGASAGTKEAVIADLQAQGGAVTDWAAETEAAAARVAAAYQKAAAAASTLPAPPAGGGDSAGAGGGGGGASAAAGGGTFMTRGPTTLTVGDNPGGVEMVSVTPISGKGSTRVGGNMARMAGGGNLLAGLDTLVDADTRKTLQRVATDAGIDEGTAEAIARVADSIAALRQLFADLNALAMTELSSGPIPAEAIATATDQANAALKLLRDGLVPISEAEAEELDRYVGAVSGAMDLVSQASDVISQTADLARSLENPPPPIDPAVVKRLASETAQIATALGSLVVPASDEAVAALEQFASSAGMAVDLITQVADLARETDDPPPPISSATIARMAAETARVATLLREKLIPDARTSNEALERYAAAVASSADILLTMADLARETASIPPPINVRGLERLADESKRIGAIVGARLARPAEKDLETMRRYQEAVGQSTAILRDIASLARELAAPAAPINEAYVKALADQTLKVGGAVGGVLVPISEENMEKIRRFSEAVERSIQIILDMNSLRQDLGAPAPPLNIEYVKALAAEAKGITALVGSVGFFGDTKAMQEKIADYAATAGQLIGLLRDVAALRGDTADVKGPIPLDLILRLRDEAKAIVAAVGGIGIFGDTKAMQEKIADYAATAANIIGVLRDVAGLRTDLADIKGGPIPIALIQELAADAKRVVQFAGGVIVPMSQETADALARYQATVGSAIGILRDTAGLRADLADLSPALNEATIRILAAEARRVTEIVRAALLPTTEQQAAEMERYAGAAGAATAILRDTAALRNELAGVKGPIPDSVLLALAQQAQRAYQIVTSKLLPVSEQQAEAISAYAGAVGSSVGILSDVASLGRDMFTDYRSPTDAQLNLIATDAMRVARAFEAGAKVFGTQGSEAVRAYGDALTSVFGGVREGLLVIDALDAREYSVDPRKLAQFEAGAGAIIATAGRLGAQAESIGVDRFDALARFGQSLLTASEGIAALASVPFDNLEALNGRLGQVGVGGGSSNTYNITINPPPGMNVNAVADAVVARIGASAASRR